MDTEDHSLGAEREMPECRGRRGDDRVHLPYKVRKWAWLQEGNSDEAEEAEVTVGISELKSCCPHFVILRKSPRLPFFEDISHFLRLSLSLSSCHALEWLPHRRGCCTWAHAQS